MPAIGMKVESTGPLFERGGKIIKNVTEGFVQRMMELGEQRLDIVLRPEPSPGVYKTKAEAQKGKASTGNYRRNVVGKRQGLVAVITDSGVVYGPWLESGKNRRSTEFRGYHAFRKTGEWLNKEMKKEAKDYTKKYVKKLSGK
jgi:hypothetical protein